MHHGGELGSGAFPWKLRSLPGNLEVSTDALDGVRNTIDFSDEVMVISDVKLTMMVRGFLTAAKAAKARTTTRAQTEGGGQTHG